MDPISAQSVLATAGAAGAGDATYVDDVFSTFVYDGTAAAKTITNGIDLSGEGGLVWIKNRDDTTQHHLYDTERGVGKRLTTTDTGTEDDFASSNPTSSLTAFNSNGFSVGDFNGINGSNDEMCSWTFRKAPGFFDVVSYTGNGTSGRTINHNLGSVPGMIIIKCRNNFGTTWAVWHRSLTSGKVLFLNTTEAESTQNYFPSSPTATNFTVSDSIHVNSQYELSYVAYVFAHDDQSFGTNSDEAIIKCGSYTGNGSSTAGPEIDLGFEPQWILIKNISRNSDPFTSWHIFDSIRGITHGYGTGNNPDPYVLANKTSAEQSDSLLSPTPTGFKIGQTGYNVGTSGDNYIYVAIRRPNKPPTAGTDVFSLGNSQINNLAPFYKTSGHVSDFVIQIRPTTASGETRFLSRLTGTRYLQPHSTAAEGTNNYYVWDYMDGMNSFTYSNDQYGYDHYSFKRAPGFFDVVAYTGTGSLSGVNHNLGVTPELKIIKRRSGTGDWIVGGSAVAGENGYIYLQSTAALVSSTNYWDGGDDSATQFSVRNGNAYSDASGSTYITYLFASLNGISKVGSYSGTGYAVNVDCGFTAGARFVLIRRTDSTADWYVWDTVRGIVSGNDPYLLINSTAAEVTNTDYIDPLNAGFTVTSSAPAALNASGGTYLFLAIA